MTTPAISPSKPQRGLAILNLCLLALLLITGFGLIAMASDRSAFASISAQVVGPGPLMGSHLTDVLVHRWVAVVTGLILLVAVVKEFVVGGVQQKLLANIALEILLGSTVVYLMFSLFQPA